MSAKEKMTLAERKKIPIELHFEEKLSVEGRCSWCRKAFPPKTLTEVMTDGAPWLMGYICDDCSKKVVEAEEAQRKEWAKRLKKIEDKLSSWCLPVRKLSDIGRESDLSTATLRIMRDQVSEIRKAAEGSKAESEKA